VKRLIASAVLMTALATFVLPAEAASPASGTITKSKRTATWSGSASMSDPYPDPVTGFLGIGDIFKIDKSCHTDTACDHFALKVTLPNNARIEVKIVTPRPNPPMGLGQPVTGDDYDLYVYDPTGKLLTGAQGTTERGNEKVTFAHNKKFNGKAYDVAVRPWMVLPGSTYKGTVTAL
jgi:hypothetical protein